VAENSDGHGHAALTAHSRQVKGKVPSRRFGYVSVVHAGRLILWGGFDGTQWLVSEVKYNFGMVRCGCG
jgi:hypothetical protein